MRYAIRTSMDLHRASRDIIPGGVNSPDRSFQLVGGPPLFVSHGKGCQVFDVEGKPYIDYIMAGGASILGHANGEIIQALNEQIKLGTSFSLSTNLECELAELVREFIPSVEMLRLMNSSSEAISTAIRIARAFTNRDRIICFSGCSHGDNDYLFVDSASPSSFNGVPVSAGVPERVASLSEVARFNHLDSVESIFEEYHGEIAAVILEPVATRMGVVPGTPEFLSGVRRLCSQNGTLLIFDESATGFRVARGGAQEIYHILPDLQIFGRIIGGGMPLSGIGGGSRYLSLLSPLGPVHQSTTLGANPLSTVCGLKTLQMLRVSGVHQSLEAIGKQLEEGLLERSRNVNIPLQINRLGSLLSIHFTDQPITDYISAHSSNESFYARFFNNLLGGGVLLPPNPYSPLFLSGAHAEMHIRKTLDLAEKAFQEL